MLFSTVTSWITSFLAASSSLWHHDRPQKLNAQPEAAAPTATAAPLHFELRHLHATAADGQVLFHDVQEHGINALALGGEPTRYPLRTQRVKAHRPASMDAFHNARVRSMRFRESVALDWDTIEVEGPDVDDRETLLLLAKMTNNAYLLPDEPGWYPLGEHWNDVSSVTLTHTACLACASHISPRPRPSRLVYGTNELRLISVSRAFHWVGSMTMTASVAMCSRRPITQRWCSPSRARPLRSSAEVARHRRRTS